MTVISPRIKKIHPKTLEKVERYRQLLTTRPTKKKVMQELKLSERDYSRLLATYREVNWSDEVIEQKRDEDLEILAVMDRKVFSDVLQGKAKASEYVAVNKHYQDTKARHGFIPSEKLNVNISGGLDVNTKIKAMGNYLLELEKRKKENKL